MIEEIFNRACQTHLAKKETLKQKDTFRLSDEMLAVHKEDATKNKQNTGYTTCGKLLVKEKSADQQKADGE